jgi:hypothetical protein
VAEAAEQTAAMPLTAAMTLVLLLQLLLLVLLAMSATMKTVRGALRSRVLEALRLRTCHRAWSSSWAVLSAAGGSSSLGCTLGSLTLNVKTLIVQPREDIENSSFAALLVVFVCVNKPSQLVLVFQWR